MSKRTMALAAVLLTGSIGAALAQGQMQQMQGPIQEPGQAQMVLPPGHPPVAGAMPVYRQQAPADAAQTRQMQGQQMQGQGAGQAGNTRAAQSTPLYRQSVPATVPLQSHIDEPRVNPSAAGTLTQWEGSSSQGQSEDRYEHSGSVGSNANTNPFTALKAGGEPREEGMTAPSGIYRTPWSTMNRDAGR